MKNIIIDLDGTITIDNKNKEYFEKDVNLKVVKKYPKGLIAKYKLFAQVCLGIFVGLMIMWGGNSGNYFYEGKTELSKLFLKDAEEALTPKDFQERREQSYGFMQRFLSVKNTIENRFDYSASEISIPFSFNIFISLSITLGSTTVPEPMRHVVSG